MKEINPEILQHAKNVLKNMDNWSQKQSNENYENFCRLTQNMNNEQLLKWFAEFSSAIKQAEKNLLKPICHTNPEY